MIAGLVALAVVWFLARGLTSPLREMVAATEAMARGDFSQRVTATSHDEIGTLARSFNQMAAELAETDRLRRDLVANVSHELRTPITALQAVLENIVDGVGGARPRDAARRCSPQVERLGRLVQQLLDLSRLESGTLPLDRASFEIAPMLELALRESRLHAADVALRRSRSSRATFSLDADAERLHQVVANLVENAVRHSPPRRHACSCGRSRTADGARLEVIDEGPGIPDAEATPRVRALLPRRLRPLVARRRRRSRARDRPLDRRAARRRHPRRAQRAARLSHGRAPSPGRVELPRRLPDRARASSSQVPVHQRKRVTVSLTSIDDALRRIRRGEMVLVVDDEDRENEGDLTLAAEWVTPEAINFMLRWARGLVCMPCDGTLARQARHRADGARRPRRLRHRVHRVDRPPQRRAAASAPPTARSRSAVLDPDVAPDDFVRPGHVFPLRAREGGVLERRGHTEAAVDLARLAGLRAGRGDLRGAARRRFARALPVPRAVRARSTASR